MESTPSCKLRGLVGVPLDDSIRSGPVKSRRGTLALPSDFSGLMSAWDNGWASVMGRMLPASGSINGVRTSQSSRGGRDSFVPRLLGAGQLRRRRVPEIEREDGVLYA